MRDDPIKTPVEDIVEISSKSTTSSKIYKRQKINSKLQLRLLLNRQTDTYNNKCSTETTSDFPLSSPTNPYTQSVLQKNSSSGDIFERNLALLTAQKPQMSLDEKINAWKCDLDLSDVEDVNNFDDIFKGHEDWQQGVFRDKSNNNEQTTDGHYDIDVFRSNVVRGKNFQRKNEKISTTSAQRRVRTVLEFEGKKLQQMNFSKRKEVPTPTFTSSSENDLVCNMTSKQRSNLISQQIVERSSFRGNTEHSSQVFSRNNLPDIVKTSDVIRPSSANVEHQIPKSEESVLMYGRLNRKLDKFNQNSDGKSRGLIQMRFDFTIENKSQQLHEKRSKLFKTPLLSVNSLQLPAPVQLPIPIKSALNISKSTSKEVNSFSCSNNSGVIITSYQSKDTELPKQSISSSPHEVDRSCCTFSPSSTCPQQQEFCNYLGLTGMSTANAVASAVADLAKCNLTRRSLRVRRLKQQERKENNRKITKDSVMRNESVSTIIEARMKAGQIIQQNETSGKMSHLPSTHDDIHVGESPKMVSPFSGHSAIEKRENSKLNKEVPVPVHKKLSRHYNQHVTNSNDNSTCPRSSISEVYCDGISSNPMPNVPQEIQNKSQANYIISPKQHSTYSSFKYIQTAKSAQDSDRIKLQLHHKFKKYLEASRKLKPSIYIVQSLHNNDTRQSLQSEENCFAEVEVENTSLEKNILKNNSSALYNVEDKNKSKLQDKQLLHLKNRQVSRQKKKNERLRKLLAVATPWHRIKNQRQLRNRKIFLVKKIKATSNKILRPKRKEINIDQAEHCSVISLVNSDTSKARNSKLKKEKLQEYKSKHRNLLNSRLRSRSTTSPADTSTENQNTKCMNENPSLEQLCKQSKSHGFNQSTKLSNNVEVNLNVSTQEHETVVVSSTTNSYDEAMLLKLNNPSRTSHELKSIQDDILPKDNNTQSPEPLGIHFVSSPSKQLQNPVKISFGRIDYIYYEMDVLIVVQEKLVSFWKYFKLINVLAGSQAYGKCNFRLSNGAIGLPNNSSSSDPSPTWLSLGDCRRITTDMEISTSYANRICVHNSMPIYVEMRCRAIPHERRYCNLLSMYINIYYFNDEEMIAKIHSIQLDTIQGLPSDVVYTTITESRYFIMSWPQQNILGKPRSGLCKYSITPNLDTLASIRDFKHIRHCVRYLECTTDDKLIGFGDTQLTVWDHRSGDVLMNYEFNMNLGINLGSIYYPTLEIGQNSILLLFQYTQISGESEGNELVFIACSISHTTPSHRIIKRLRIPYLVFDEVGSAINTGDNIIITTKNDEEIWINCADATTITRVPPQNTRRFYARGRSQIIELTSKSLTVDSFANHVLKLAANPVVKKASTDVKML
ncbi:unnamed protein product [Ceratitis capitata]|uniref:(Mediterranean fruit fly) hypothetical protein n=1 Tax=Ceratitis capitata TaxID=7213 RepID=W8BUB5_CERCA|nr:unnamed protein product [Ceratitis capitata]